MKILMFGRGVISSIYGWALEQAGHSVHFYVRPGRANQYGGELQMQITDVRQGLFSKPSDETWPVTFREEMDPDHDYDLIILSVQHYHFAQAAEKVAEFVGNASVLIFNNFWEEPQEMASMLPAEQLVWGFPAAGGGIENDVVRGSLFGSVTFGTFGETPSKRAVEVRDLFAQSGFGVKEEADFRSWLFIHFAQNAAALSEFLLPEHQPKPRLSLSAFYNVSRNGKELVPLLAARGVLIKEHTSAVIFRMPAIVTSLILWCSFKFVAPVKNSMAPQYHRPQSSLVC